MAIVGLLGLGYVAEQTSPAAAVVLAGAAGMSVMVVAAWFWPHRQVRSAVRATFGVAPRRH